MKTDGKNMFQNIRLVTSSTHFYTTSRRRVNSCKIYGLTTLPTHNYTTFGGRQISTSIRRVTAPSIRRVKATSITCLKIYHLATSLKDDNTTS